MLSKNKIKLINSLAQKKYRQEHALFIVEGEKMVNELLQLQLSNSSRFSIAEIYYTLAWKEKQLDDLEDLNAVQVEVKQSELERISQFQSANQVLALVNIPEQVIPNYGDEHILILDGIRDPGNLGTILRTADWFGINEVICSDDCVDLYNPKVVQASMGSVFRVHVLSYDLKIALKQLKRHHPLKPFIGATLQGENVYNMNLPEHAFIIMGSESHGIRPDAFEYLTKQIKIPSFGGGESLNVATAAAVLCSEFKRR